MLIRLIGIKFTNLIQGDYQIDLFNDTIRDINLMQTIDKLRARYGVDCLTKGNLM